MVNNDKSKNEDFRLKKNFDPLRTTKKGLDTKAT